MKVNLPTEQKIFPEYKANRETLKEKQTDQERLDFEAFIKEFSRTIDIYKSIDDYPVLKFSKVEADDIAAYIVRKYKKTHNIWLMSSDKDWDLLLDNNVSRFSYVLGKEIRLDNWKDYYDYEPDEHISIKCLTGDSGDNIPGVEGVGIKRAEHLVRQYGSTYDIIASLPISSKYVHINKLNSFGADKLLLNYQLMDLVTYCEDALGEENCKIIDLMLGNYLKCTTQ